MENNKKFEVNFNEMLNDSAEVFNLLNRIYQGHLQVGKILSCYEKNNNRFGVIFMAKDTNTERLEKIIIDAICGEPNSTQVKELTYDQGADCDKRIILYTLSFPHYTKNEYRHEHEMMNGFAKVNNDCGVDTFVVQVYLRPDKIYEYDVEIQPDENKWTSFKKLPTKFEFEKAIFKVFYNQSDRFGWYYNDYMGNIDGWFTGTFWVRDQDGIRSLYPVWDENGLFVQANSLTHKGDDYLNSIKENNQKYLRRMFIGRETTFEIAPSGRVTMLIKLWDKPLSFFSKVSPVDKEIIAEYLRGLGRRIGNYWNYSHCLDGSMNEYVETCLAIPEDTFNELEKEISA